MNWIMASNDIITLWTENTIHCSPTGALRVCHYAFICSVYSALEQSTSIHFESDLDDGELGEELDNDDEDNQLFNFMDDIKEDFPFPPHDTPQTDEAKKQRLLDILRRIRDDPLCSFRIPSCMFTLHSLP